MKKFLVLLLISFRAFSGSAQMTVAIGANNGTNSTLDYPCPIQDFYYATHAQYLYTSSELSAMGILPGTNITQIGWVVEPTIFSGHLSEGYSIYLLNTSIGTLDLNSWETGASLVYGPINYSYPSGYGGNVIFPIIPFVYTGGNLIVEVCGGISSGGFVNNPQCQWTTGLPFNASHQWRQDVSDGCGNVGTGNSANQSNRPVLLASFISINLEFPTIEGDVYYDQNQNGIRDGGEIGLANNLISISGFYGLTDMAGHYVTYQDTGSYTSSWVPSVPWTLTSSPVTYSIAIPPNSQNNDFGIWADPVDVEYSQLVGYVTGMMRCNVVSHSSLNINNTGVYQENGTVTLIHSANLPFNTGSSTSGFTISGDTVRWTYSNLLPGQMLTYHGDFNNGPAGDTVTFTYIDSVFDASWNFQRAYSNSFTFVIACSFDPNDKAVDPPGVDVEHYTLMDEELQYTIRFQNTGNDTAFNVMITDMLDANLDLATLQIIASSHPVSLQISQSGEMKFMFSNILLPDSIVDEPGSHGYVVYKVKHSSGIPEGTTIYNTAYIIFDSNPAVVTNTTYNNLVTQIPTGISEKSLASNGYIYPNTVTDQAWIILHDRTQDKHLVSIYNSIGEELLTETFTGNQFLLKEKVQAGIYFVSVSDAEGKPIYCSRFIKE
jgi:uncharacterized repeat protein (TIGR01451 family)